MKKKIRKSVVATIFAIIMGYIAGMSIEILVIGAVIGSHVGLSYQSVRVCFFVFLFMFVLFFGLTFMSIVIPYKTEEKEKNRYEDLKECLKDAEMEVCYQYNNRTESEILKALVKQYESRYLVKIGENNTIDLIVREKNGTEICTINISDLGYFFDHFEFKGPSEESN